MHNERNTQKVMYRRFRVALRSLLVKIPPSEYPRIIAEAEELTRQIKANPTLYEPVHCAHPDEAHGVIRKRHDGSTAAMIESRHAVRNMADKILSKAVVA